MLRFTGGRVNKTQVHSKHCYIYTFLVSSIHISPLMRLKTQYTSKGSTTKFSTKGVLNVKDLFWSALQNSGHHSTTVSLAPFKHSIVLRTLRATRLFVARSTVGFYFWMSLQDFLFKFRPLCRESLVKSKTSKVRFQRNLCFY